MDQAQALNEKFFPLWSKYHAQDGVPVPGAMPIKEGKKAPMRGTYIGYGNSPDESYNFCKWILSCNKLRGNVVPSTKWWLTASEASILAEMFGERYWVYFRSQGDKIYLNGELP